MSHPVLGRDALHTVHLTLNGRERRGQAQPRLLLSDFLRHELGATGTHVGCEHGVCGACTVWLPRVCAPPPDWRPRRKAPLPRRPAPGP